MTGSDADRAFRNRLQLHWLARECAAWIKKKVDLRCAPALLPQSILIAGSKIPSFVESSRATVASRRKGWALRPATNSASSNVLKNQRNPPSWLVVRQPVEFTAAVEQAKAAFLSRLQDLADPKAPSLVYYLTLFQIFKDLGDQWMKSGS